MGVGFLDSAKIRKKSSKFSNIVAKFAIDLGGHFGVQKVSKGLPKGGNTGGKTEAKSLPEATCAEKAETLKIALAPLREH